MLKDKANKKENSGATDSTELELSGAAGCARSLAASATLDLLDPMVAAGASASLAIETIVFACSDIVKGN